MSPITVLLCLQIFVASGLADHTEVEVRRGEDAILQCRGPRGADITLLEWSRPDLSSGGYVLFYRNKRPFDKYQHDSFRGRVQLIDPSMTNGDVSVILRNANIGDTGTYECLITAMDASSGGSVLSEFKHSVGLRVINSYGGDNAGGYVYGGHGGDNAGGYVYGGHGGDNAGGYEYGGHGGYEAGGYEDGCLSLKASLSVCAMLLAVLLLL